MEKKNVSLVTEIKEGKNIKKTSQIYWKQSKSQIYALYCICLPTQIKLSIQNSRQLIYTDRYQPEERSVI